MITVTVIITSLFILAVLWLSGELLEKITKMREEKRTHAQNREWFENAYFEGYCDGFSTGKRA